MLTKSPLKVLLITVVIIKNYLVEATVPKCVKNPRTITLPQGRIKGSYDVDKSQIKFLGIPYASVIDKFQAPSKPPSWNGTFMANQTSIHCKQYHTEWKTVIGQENCLVLNVFTPTYRYEKPFPVMVFIHGGSYSRGSNTEWEYNPKYLVKEKVIVVTINYRLGALGFLCLPLKEAPGNAGLKDQLAALRWIQHNIAYFGGDSNCVTLFGQSVGAASVNYFIQTHSAEGLFHRAILESGTMMMSQAFSYTPIESASKVALRLGYNTSDPKELLEIYKNTPVDNIIQASSSETINDPFANVIFGPCMETAITTERPLITESPSDLLKKDGLNISVIIGFNNKEGIGGASAFVPINLKKIEDNFDNIIPTNLLFENKADKKAFINDIMSIYFSNGSITDNLIDYLTDSGIRYPVSIVSERFCKMSRTVYNYYFTYDSIRNVYKLMTKLSTIKGAGHFDELPYLFEPLLYNLPTPSAKDRAMLTRMVKLWTSFAKTGEPTDSMTTWRPCQEHLNFIQLGEEIKTITLPHEDRIKFWRNVYKKYGRT